MRTTRPKPKQSDLTAFLPMTREEMSARGWDELDILLVSADAYVDHPTFGVAMIGRWLESKGFRVGIIAQPDSHDPGSVTALDRPRRLRCRVNAIDDEDDSILLRSPELRERLSPRDENIDSAVSGTLNAWRIAVPACARSVVVAQSFPSVSFSPTTTGTTTF